MNNLKNSSGLRNPPRGIVAFVFLVFCALTFAQSAAAQNKTVIKVGESDKPVRDRAQLWLASQARLDGKDSVFYYKGAAYSHIANEAPIKLFNVEGYNIRRLIETPEKDGYFIAAREVLFFQDAKTGEILGEWQNPLTNEKNQVVHIANDSVNLRYRIRDQKYVAVSLDGKREFGEKPLPEEANDQFVWHSDAALFDATPDGENTVKNRAVIGFFDYYVAQNELYKIGAPKVTVSWTRAAPWLPWMRMNERAGTMLIHARGVRLESWLFLPDKFKNQIRAKFPLYQSAPDKVDAARANPISFTVFPDETGKRE